MCIIWSGMDQALSSIVLSGEVKNRGEDLASSWGSLEDGKVWRGQGPLPASLVVTLRRGLVARKSNTDKLAAILRGD